MGFGQNKIVDYSDNLELKSGNLPIRLLSVLLVVLLLVDLFFISWTAHQFLNRTTVPAGLNIIIKWPEDSAADQKTADWLTVSLQAAGFNVQADTPERPSWLITVGLSDAGSIDQAFSWPDTNLLMVDPVSDQSRKWLDWAYETAADWPADRKMFMVSSKSDNDNLRILYELVSGEDATLLPGFDTNRGRNIETWLSLDTGTGLSIVPVDGLEMPWYSAAFIDEITAVVISHSVNTAADNQIKSIAEASGYANQKVLEIRMVSLILLILFLLFQALLSLRHLKMLAGNLTISKIGLFRPDLITILFSLLSILLISLAIFIVNGPAFISSLAWFILIPIMLLSFITVLPSAVLGKRQRNECITQLENAYIKEQESPAALPVRGSSFWTAAGLLLKALIILTVIVTALINFIIFRRPFDSWLWLFAAAVLSLAGGSAARQLAVSGSGVVTATLAGGWLTALALSLLSSYF
jgi:hypothetical protein